MADGLIRLSVLTHSVFARVAERHGLPAAQARLLCVLAGGSRGMSELAGLLGIEKAALTGLADRAERRGLIARTAVPGDRRALSVALTPGGRDAASAFHLELSAELARLTDALPAAERDRFCRSLRPRHRGRALASPVQFRPVRALRFRRFQVAAHDDAGRGELLVAQKRWKFRRIPARSPSRTRSMVMSLMWPLALARRPGRRARPVRAVRRFRGDRGWW